MTAPTSTPRPDESREARIGRGLRWMGAWSWRWIGIAIFAALVGWIVGVIWVAVLPLVLALILTSVLYPVAALLANRTFLPWAAAAGLVMVGGLAVIGTAVTVMAPAIAGEWGSIVDDAVAGLRHLQEWAADRGLVSDDQLDSVIDDARDRLSDSAGAIAGGVLTGVNTVTSWVVTLVLTLVLTFLFLKDGHRFLPWVNRTAGDRVGERLHAVLNDVWRTLGGFIRTQALVGLIDAVLIGIVLVIVGVPLAIPLAVLTFIGAFIPILGAFIAGALAVLVALVTVSPTGALVVLIGIVVIQQLEGNVLQPWLQGKVMQLHAAVILLSVTLGSTLYGVAGAFLAVPVAAVFAVVLRHLSRYADPPVPEPVLPDDAADDTGAPDDEVDESQ